MSERSLLERATRKLRARLADSVAQVARPLRRLRNSEREYRPIFVAGAMGSGTSLVAVALGSRFECAGVAYESAREVAPDSFLHVRAVSEYTSVDEYTRALRSAASWSHAAGRSALQHCYRANASGPHDIIIDKGPNANLLRAEFLAECFPQAPFLLVFRDPAVNIEGFRRKWETFARDPLDASIRFYREIYEHFLEVAAGLGERLVAVDYDELVQDYDASLDAIGARLGLGAATAPRRLQSRENAPGKGLRNVSGNQIHVVKNASAAAYDRLDPGEAQAIEQELGPLHQRLRELARSGTQSSSKAPREI